MKKSIFFLFLASCCSFSTACAQNLIALQHNGAASFFTTIPDAVTAAVSGDTIFLPGGSFLAFNIDKKLAIIGVGHNPDSTAATGMTLISGTISFGNGDCDGSVLTGLRVNGEINSSGLDNDNVQISRCFIISGITPNGNGSGGSENWTISECFFPTIQFIKNSFVSNNLIAHFILNAQDCQIENNAFLYDAYLPIVGNSCMVKNNIFNFVTDCCVSGQQISNSLFDNNIWSSGSLPNGVFGTGNIGTGNINDPNFDGLFTNFSYTTYTGNINNPYPFDFHLVNAAYNTGGTNGTPIGIYGGTFPWKDGSLPFNPHILFKSIGNSTDQNGNLLINIHVEAQDH